MTPLSRNGFAGIPYGDKFHTRRKLSDKGEVDNVETSHVGRTSTCTPSSKIMKMGRKFSEPDTPVDGKSATNGSAGSDGKVRISNRSTDTQGECNATGTKLNDPNKLVSGKNITNGSTSNCTLYARSESVGIQNVRDNIGKVSSEANISADGKKITNNAFIKNNCKRSPATEIESRCDVVNKSVDVIKTSDGSTRTRCTFRVRSKSMVTVTPTVEKCELISNSRMNEDYDKKNTSQSLSNDLNKKTESKQKCVKKSLCNNDRSNLKKTTHLSSVCPSEPRGEETTSKNKNVTDGSRDRSRSGPEVETKNNEPLPVRRTASNSQSKLKNGKKSIVSMFETIAAEEAINKKRGEFIRRKTSTQYYQELDNLVQQKDARSRLTDQIPEQEPDFGNLPSNKSVSHKNKRKASLFSYLENPTITKNNDAVSNNQDTRSISRTKRPPKSSYITKSGEVKGITEEKKNLKNNVAGTQTCTGASVEKQTLRNVKENIGISGDHSDDSLPVHCLETSSAERKLTSPNFNDINYLNSDRVNTSCKTLNTRSNMERTWKGVSTCYLDGVNTNCKNMDVELTVGSSASISDKGICLNDMDSSIMNDQRKNSLISSLPNSDCMNKDKISSKSPNVCSLELEGKESICSKSSKVSTFESKRNESILNRTKSDQHTKRNAKSESRFSEQKKSLVNMFENIAVEESLKKKQGELIRKKSFSRHYKEIQDSVEIKNNEKVTRSSLVILKSDEPEKIDKKISLYSYLSEKPTAQNDEVKKYFDNEIFFNAQSNLRVGEKESEVNIRTRKLSAPEKMIPSISEGVKKVGQMLESEADIYLALGKDLDRINADISTVKSDINVLSTEVQKNASLSGRLSKSQSTGNIKKGLYASNGKCRPITNQHKMKSLYLVNKLSDNLHPEEVLNSIGMEKGDCLKNSKDVCTQNENNETSVHTSVKKMRLSRKKAIYSMASPVVTSSTATYNNREKEGYIKKKNNASLISNKDNKKLDLQKFSSQQHVMIDDDGFHSSTGSECGNVQYSSYADSSSYKESEGRKQHHCTSESSTGDAPVDGEESEALFRLVQNKLKLDNLCNSADTNIDVFSSTDDSDESDFDTERKTSLISKSVQQTTKRMISTKGNPFSDVCDKSWVTQWVHGKSGDSEHKHPSTGNKILCLDDLRKRRSNTSEDISEKSDGEISTEQRYISVNEQLEIYEDLRSEGLEVVADKETRDIISDTISAFNGNGFHKSLSFRDKLGIPMDNSTNNCNSISSDEEETDTGSNSTVIDAEERRRASADFSGIKKIWKKKDGKVGGMIHEKKPHSDEGTSTTFSTMFGYFNYCLFIFISKEFGLDTWKKVISGRKLTRKQIVMFEKPRHDIVDDALTDKVLRYASSLLDLDFKVFLQKYGNYYFQFCSSKYGDILKSIATNLADFINNMDDIRRHIHKIEKIVDDHPPSIYASVDRSGGLLLYYHSHRDQKYLEHFIIGYLKAAALNLYDMHCEVHIQQERSVREDLSIISINALTSLSRQPSSPFLQVSTQCEDLVVEPYIMDDIFPFHMILDENLDMSQIGVSLNRLVENYIPKYGLNIKNYFKLVKPAIKFCYKTIKNNLNTAFIFASHENMFTESFSNGLVLKGQITYLASSGSLWFIASPKVDRLSQLNELSLSSIPLHDATREVLLISEQSHAQDTLKSQLQVLTNRLKDTSKELALGKINTETILDEIFPKEVAYQLMQNKPVPAVTAEEVSILFTDIVGFTRICGECDPEDITDMLNSLYLEFDVLCEKYEVYKVETIGDAYMAVGGIHRKDKEHGRSTTLMGIEMVERASKVCTPTGESIQIRVGIHSGSVVAGVVGTRMPRYCLFGNNVTLANKTESTSEARRVHISPATYLEIKHHQEFVFWYRKREVMPPLMQKLYKGNTFFVTQRRPTYFDDTHSESDRRLKYMKARSIENELSDHGNICSRRNSLTGSVCSECQDYQKYPEALREQLHALEKINGYEIGKRFLSHDVA